MDLKEYFVSKSRELAIKLKTYSPTIKKLVTGKGKNKEISGVLSSIQFSDFKVDISYTEKGRQTYAQQTIWVSFVLDADTTLPFSIYDILAVTDPENFNCYTYTYVDSVELMKNCFAELQELLERVIPKLQAYLESGVNKNALISSQRDTINKYFGDNVLEASETLGGQADALINMMLNNFYKAQIEAAVLGSQALFYSGKTQKALKSLRKSKYRSAYQDNLLKYLENGGTALNISETAKNASADKGTLRHGGGIKGALSLLGFTFLYMIPVSGVLCIFYYLLANLLFRRSEFIYGIAENMILVPFMGIFIALGFSLKRQWNIEKNPDSTDTAVHAPKSKTTDNIIKYFIIAGETLAFIGIMTCVYSATPFYSNSFSYATDIFPLAQNTCDYDSVNYIALIDGYYFDDNSFTDEKYIAIKTESGAVIDLYNSTFFTAEKITQHKDFFDKKGIEIKNVKTIEDIK